MDDSFSSCPILNIILLLESQGLHYFNYPRQSFFFFCHFNNADKPFGYGFVPKIFTNICKLICNKMSLLTYNNISLPPLFRKGNHVENHTRQPLRKNLDIFFTY